MKNKQKKPTKNLFQGIKSFGLDRIIDIWILLQPEEERRKREYRPAGCGRGEALLGGRGQLVCDVLLLLPEKAGLVLCFYHQDWDA